MDLPEITIALPSSDGYFGSKISPYPIKRIKLGVF